MDDSGSFSALAAFVGCRVRLDYHDHGESFARHLPVEGTVSRRCTASTGPDDWYLVELDEPIDFQHPTGPHYRFERLVVPRVLIRSRFAGEPLGPDSEPSVFLLLVGEGQEVPEGPLEIDAYVHVCWARCRVLQAGPVARLDATLEEIVALLHAHGEEHWSAWLAGDLERIRKGDAYGIEHLLSAYGGMGSFSDLFLSPENGSRIAASEVGPVNERLRRLASRAHDLARAIERAS